MQETQQGTSEPAPTEPIAAALPEEAQTKLPEHLIGLPGGRWALWRWAALRGAGFPAASVLELCAPACAAAADQLIQAELAAQQARDTLAHALATALAARQREVQQAEEQQRDLLRAEIRRVVQRTTRRLNHMRLLDPADAALVDPALVDPFQAAVARRDAARADFDQAFAAGVAQVSHAILQIAHDNRFREAIILQNRGAFHTGIATLKSPDTSRNYTQRLSEELVANYLQRYCVKNDTIGFFGPVGWARIEPRAEALVARPGPQLLATRTVYFDEWGINALAHKLAENQALLPWIAPRRMPFLHIDGATLYLPPEASIELSAQQRAVLQACDGTRTARDIALHLIRNPRSGLANEPEVYDVLRYLRDRGLIAWTLEVPMELRPENTLRRLLERIGMESLRRQALGALNELESARAVVARAAGDAEKLDQALGDLEATFTRLTAVHATRSAGKIYAGRTLVYEDCRRDIEVEIGAPLLQALGPPLSLLLQSARWLTSQAAALYQQAFREVYVELARATGTPTVDLLSFWRRVLPILADKSRVSQTLMPMLQDRWATIFGIPEGQHQTAYTTAELQPRVQAMFDAQGPGWLSACYHSPDVLIAASSAEAIRRGDYQLVMGELHAGMNTLTASTFVAQHPAQEELFAAIEIDLSGPRIVPMIPRSWDRMTSRTRPALLSLGDYRLVFANDSPGVPKSRALPIAALVVEDTGGGLIVRTRDGRLRFDIIETFAPVLSAFTAQSFHVLRPGGHTPRVTIDRLVVCREAWHCPLAELSFADARDEAERFLAARRWMRAQGMPRWVFVKVPVEEKPFYVDFDSPIYVNIFAKMIRRTVEHGPPNALITITEMLPEPERVWLPDAAGQRYTCELRFVAVCKT